jgi:hypothetical protein
MFMLYASLVQVARALAQTLRRPIEAGYKRQSYLVTDFSGRELLRESTNQRLAHSVSLLCLHVHEAI